MNCTEFVISSWSRFSAGWPNLVKRPANKILQEILEIVQFWTNSFMFSAKMACVMLIANLHFFGLMVAYPKKCLMRYWKYFLEINECVTVNPYWLTQNRLCRSTDIFSGCSWPKRRMMWCWKYFLEIDKCVTVRVIGSGKLRHKLRKISLTLTKINFGSCR